MRTISYWASLHTKTAISLIVVIDVLKNWAGIHLGYRFFPALPAIVIELVVIGIVTGALLIETHYNRQVSIATLTKIRRYQLRTRSTFCLFMASFLLSILVGNRFHHVITPQSGGFTAYASVSHIERPAHEVERSTTDDVGKTRPLTRQELREERRLARHKHPQRPTEQSTGVSILLFFLGVGLAIAGAGLACNLSCSNHGFAAVLVGILALGALAGGIYFLVKALRRKSPTSTTPRN